MSSLRDFELEIYFGKYEFIAPFLLAQSDCETMKISELLKLESGAEQKFMNSSLGYTEALGNPELRNVIASLYTTMKDEDILVHAGAQEAIYSYMNVLLESGDHVISIFPTYQSLYEVALSKGCEVSRWNLKNIDNKWTIDFDELRNLIKSNTKLIVVNTPNNPTGYTFNEKEIRELCEIASKHGIYIFSDEVYKGLDLDGVKKAWIADIYDNYGKNIYS